MWHWNGNKWALTQLAQGLYALAGRASNDVWAAGRAGTVLRWDGTPWSSFSSTNEDLHALWVGPAGDVWMAGTAGTILRHH